MEYRPIDYFRRAEEAAKGGNIDAHILILKELVSISQLSSQPTEWSAEALRWLGNAYQTKNNIPLAHSYRIEALKVVQQLGKNCGHYAVMSVEGDLGRSFIALKEWQEAEIHTRRALSLANELDELGEYARCIFRIN